MTTGFEVDWDAIADVLAEHSGDHFSWAELAQFAIVAYEAQRAAGGWVSVRREDVEVIARCEQKIEFHPTVGAVLDGPLALALERFRAMLAASEVTMEHT